MLFHYWMIIIDVWYANLLNMLTIINYNAIFNLFMFDLMCYA